ncbi:sensor domain-containing diguanylate cyclase [Sneathiella limimaris]|uniref:sensor domain-containing diguanylate cyclase n=1 Tax=Sneathiella limimaris TaxID=1964213 RepID=UPI00146AFF65|nr:sensor domain-containing diguanylate cyclase [Sneathiella limimaris]
MGLFRNPLAKSLEKQGTANQLETCYAVERELVLSDFPGLVFVINKDLEVLEVNERAGRLLQNLSEEDREQLVTCFQAAVSNIIPNLQTLKIERSSGEPEIFDFTFLPLENMQGHFLALGQDTSMQRNLTNALINSRQMFKDLIDCVSEFVWETDESGQFKYVSRGGAFGYAAAELDGMITQDLLLGSGKGHDVDYENPFVSWKPVKGQQIWARSKGGKPVCLQVTAMPLFDKAGNWIGCRGAGKDITQEVDHLGRMDKLAAQEKLLSSVVDAIRHEVDPEKLFQIAGEKTLDALGARRLQIARVTTSGQLTVEFSKDVTEDVRSFLNSWFESSKVTPDEEHELITCHHEGQKLFISPFYVKGKLNGYIAIVRQGEAMDLTAEEKHLLHHLADHIEVALIQVLARERLIELTRTDELSGLLNRRAFHQDVAQRIAHGKRTGNRNALFYVDLDNFKPVNDRFGHEKGDEVLKAVSDLLSENSRVGDLVARLGGDEFAIWFEDMPPKKATEKALWLQQQCKEVSARLEIKDPELGFSIGIVCTSGAATEHLDGLLNSADAAMYEVKKQGKGSFSLVNSEEADPAEKEGKDVTQ